MLGETLPAERPIVAEAITNGLLGIDTAATILFSLKQAAQGCEATPENMDAAELALAQLGSTDSADLVADIGRVWRDALDPDGIEPRYEQIRERRGVFIGRERNGIKKYAINAGPTLSAVLDAVFLDPMDPKVGPRFLSDEDLARATTLVEDVNGDLVETILDPRSLEQKQHDILEGVLTAGLRATGEGPANLRTIGSVTAVIQLKDLHNGTGFGILEGTDEVIPAAAVQEMVCDTGFFQVVLGSKGEPLLAGLTGAPAPHWFRVAVGAELAGRPSTSLLIPYRLEGGLAVATGWRTSTMMRGLADSLGVLVCPPEGVVVGADAEAFPLPWG